MSTFPQILLVTDGSEEANLSTRVAVYTARPARRPGGTCQAHAPIVWVRRPHGSRYYGRQLVISSGEAAFIRYPRSNPPPPTGQTCLC